MDHITIMFEADYERGVILAHCLDFDLVTTAPSLHEVKSKMQALLMAHLEYAEQHDLDPFCRAPQEFWDRAMQFKEMESRSGIRIRSKSSDKGESAMVSLQELCPA
jgi:hypothetical protein